MLNLHQFLTTKDGYLQAIHQKSQLEQLSRQHGCVNKDENGLGREEMTLASETVSSACRHAGTKNGQKGGKRRWDKDKGQIKGGDEVFSWKSYHTSLPHVSLFPG